MLSIVSSTQSPTYSLFAKSLPAEMLLSDAIGNQARREAQMTRLNRGRPTKALQMTNPSTLEVQPWLLQVYKNSL